MHYRGIIDKTAIKNDWLTLKKWFLNPATKINRLIIITLLILVIGMLGVPVFLSTVNTEIAFGVAFIFSVPFLLMLISFVPFIVNSSFLVFFWISEKGDITRFRHLSEREIKSFIRSRLFIPLFLSFVTEGVLIGIALVYISIYYHPVQIFPLNSIGIWLYFIGLIIYTIFNSIFLNWNAITHGNYLRFILPQNLKEKPSNISQELYQRFNELKNISFTKTGAFLIVFSTILIVMLYFIPLILAALFLFDIPTQSSQILEFTRIGIWYWTWIWNIVLILLTWILWRITPSQLQNVPENRYIIPEDLERLLKT
ncbi:MAG: hypothetical protein ACFFC7_04935 [Candidatus Hermodarchaeota archaeon]